MNKKITLVLKLSLFFLLSPVLSAEPLYSPTWGFRIDLPEGYEYAEGNNLDRYSFQGPNGAKFDIAVYKDIYHDLEHMASDINRRLENNGDTAFFEYGNKDAVILELQFLNFAGWGIGVELAVENALLLALAYAPAERKDMDLYHLSALDSIVPSESERFKPGPIMEFGYPRGEFMEGLVFGTGGKAIFRENDAEAAQALIDREFSLLARYQFSMNWQEAWVRFYRAIYRDSWDRIADAVFFLEKYFKTGSSGERDYAEKALAWVQSFAYERDLEGSDFVNLVSAIIEGKGDCDSRAMLLALVVRQADIPAAIMVSRRHSHAMGLVDVSGGGARFESHGIRWLVAETTANVTLGLIDQEMSDSESWIAVVFE